MSVLVNKLMVAADTEKSLIEFEFQRVESVRAVDLH